MAVDIAKRIDFSRQTKQQKRELEFFAPLTESFIWLRGKARSGKTSSLVSIAYNLREYFNKTPILDFKPYDNFGYYEYYVREALGIDITEGYVTTDLLPEEIMSGLTKLVMDIATQRKSVDDIRHKDNRADYIYEFTKECLPDTNVTPVETWKIQAQASSVKPHVPPGGAVSAMTGKKSIPLSTSRRTLIPPNCVLRIKNATRINKIYKELRGLEVKGFENACAITFRVFLELSVENYAKAKNIVCNEGESLASKIGKVAKYMESKKLMSKDELKPIRLACSTPDNLVSTHTLNAYVHNPNLSPKADNLKLTWDDFEKFFKTMW